uniref:Aspartic protease pep1 n=1 Tax=Talaromyces marneffei PM1 TaxID=1077442 RepID=A0A093UM48_TALMA
MVNYKTIVGSVLALPALASAVPTPVPPLSPSRTFTAKQVLIGNSTANPVGEYLRALAKYGAHVPDPVLAAPISNQTGSVITKPSKYDMEYATPVLVGNSTLLLDFDTGSSELWVFINETKGRGSHNTYDHRTGTLFPNATWHVTYGDYSYAKGIVYRDTVNIGGVIAPNQTVEAALQVSESFIRDLNNDGLVGLAFPNINMISPGPQNTFFANVMDTLAKPVFAVTLKHQAPGSYDFGFVDKDKFKGELIYKPVRNETGFWTFMNDGFCIVKCGLTPTGRPFRGIVDTGTSLLILDDDIVMAYYRYVSTSRFSPMWGGVIFNCNSKLPAFIVKVDDYLARVPGNLISPIMAFPLTFSVMFSSRANSLFSSASEDSIGVTVTPQEVRHTKDMQ